MHPAATIKPCTSKSCDHSFHSHSCCSLLLLAIKATLSWKVTWSVFVISFCIPKIKSWERKLRFHKSEEVHVRLCCLSSAMKKQNSKFPFAAIFTGRVFVNFRFPCDLCLILDSNTSMFISRKVASKYSS